MMPLNPEEELKQLDKKMVRVSIIDTPGMIALALGLFAKFSDDPGGLHPIFEDPSISTALVVGGGGVVGWAAFQMIGIARRRRELLGELDT